MGALICPTVTARSPRDFDQQLAKVADLGSRIQIDLGDGVFTSELVMNPDALWPPSLRVDFHVMHQRPAAILPELIAKRPHMIILHAEASGHILELLKIIKSQGIKTGIALLQDTSVLDARNLLATVDHVLIFSGLLGHFGGHVDLKLLNKVPKIKLINPDIEFGWDGGANLQNVRQLADGGIDVINVGGAIQLAENPPEIYASMERRIMD